MSLFCQRVRILFRFIMQAILKRFLWLRSNQRILYNCENILELRVCHLCRVKYVRNRFYLIRLNLIKYYSNTKFAESFKRKIFYHKIYFKYECSSVRVRLRACVCACVYVCLALTIYLYNTCLQDLFYAESDKFVKYTYLFAIIRKLFKRLSI